MSRNERKNKKKMKMNISFWKISEFSDFNLDEI